MSHEMIISGGTVVDGSGADGFKADVAIDNGKISRIGDLTGEQAAKAIDATDRIVTPGFVDLHTHLDAQVGWDPQMSSSSYHGVTTALIGNCGVTFAPVTKKNHRYLAELMEAVEDIAADAIMEDADAMDAVSGGNDDDGDAEIFDPEHPGWQPQLVGTEQLVSSSGEAYTVARGSLAE